MNLKEKILSANIPSDRLAVFYTGQVGFILKFRDKYILVDGYLSDIIDRTAQGPVVWKRNYPSPISGAELDFVDYVFCTHDHTDHADPETLKNIASVNSKVKFFASEAFLPAMRGYVGNDAELIGVKADEKITLCNGISLTPIPSAHEELHLDENGCYKELGFIFDFDGITFYHSGDSCMYEGLDKKISNVDIMAVPINGRDFFRNADDIIGCFDSYEAVMLAKKANAKLLIPTHFDMYPVNGVNPAYFVDTLYKINPGQCFHIFMPGECYIY